MDLPQDNPQDPASARSPETPTPKFSNHKGRSFIRRLLLPTIIGLISFAAVLVLWQRLISQQRAKVQVVTSSETLFVKNKVESELAERILTVASSGRTRQRRVEFRYGPGDERARLSGD